MPTIEPNFEDNAGTKHFGKLKNTLKISQSCHLSGEAKSSAQLNTRGLFYTDFWV
jgi:hypothetical protein